MKRKRATSEYCGSSLRVTATRLLSFLAITAPAIQPVAADSFLPQAPLILPQPSFGPPEQRETFQLRQVFHHGTYRHPGLLRKLNVAPSSRTCLQEEDGPCIQVAERGFEVSSNPLKLQKLVDHSPTRMNALMVAGRERGSPLDLPSSDWTVGEVKGPNVTDKATVLSLAKMASNAYTIDPSDGDWEDLGDIYNRTESFGWDSDGLRGHVFTDVKNGTVIIGLKGTTPAVFDGADTTTNDKVNDNLFFSCCCGQGGAMTWRQVCDCKTETYTCNSTCVVQNLRREDRYYAAARELFLNVTALYPKSEIWITGHSLGGAVSSLIGLTYFIPAVTFEAPGDAMPAARLGLPTPPGYHIGGHGSGASTGGFHFGHTGDPVFLGNCASCTLGGYAMESKCHTGMECRYDTVKDLGYHNYIGNHKISSVIRDVLEVYDKPAKCEVITDCTDCFNWKFFKSHKSVVTTTTSSSTSSYSQTRTETCKTPGWFGCLDETTTSGPISTTSTTSTSSTSTCKTPGWFGCLDETTTTTSSATSSTTSSSTSTCKTPGWFGCNDPTSTVKTKTKSKTKTPTTTSSATTTTTCKTPGWFWGCRDLTTSTTMPTTTSHSTSSTCKTPGFFWGCYDPTTTTAAALHTAEMTAPRAAPAHMITNPGPLPTHLR